MSDSKSRRPAVIVAKTRDAAVSVIPRGKQAGASAAEGVRKGLHGARGWAAPRFEGAADVVDTKVAPKMSGALRATARTISPEVKDGAFRRGLNSMMSWRGLTAVIALAAAAGTAAAMTMRRRYNNATTEAKASAEAAGTAKQQDEKAGLDGSRSEQERVSAAGW